MTAVLYLDVYFAVNFFMDFLLLLLVRKLLGICAENRKMAPGRTLRLAAAAGVPQRQAEREVSDDGRGRA